MSHAPKVLIKLNPIGLAQILHSNLTGPRAKPKDEEHNMTTGKFNFNALAIAAAVAKKRFRTMPCPLLVWAGASVGR